MTNITPPLDLYVVEEREPEWGWEFVDWYRTRERAEDGLTQRRERTRYSRPCRIVHYVAVPPSSEVPK